MVCSYGDQNDVSLFRELGLEEVVAIGLDGKMTEVAGEYAGRPLASGQRPACLRSCRVNSSTGVRPSPGGMLEGDSDREYSKD